MFFIDSMQKKKNTRSIRDKASLFRRLSQCYITKQMDDNLTSRQQITRTGTYFQYSIRQNCKGVHINSGGITTGGLCKKKKKS
jgi:hypothetical protein